MMENEWDTFGPLASWLARLPRRVKRMLMISADIIAVSVSLLCSIMLANVSDTVGLASTWWLYPLAIAVFVPIFIRIGLYRTIVRFMGSKVFSTVLRGVLFAVVAFGVIAKLLLPAITFNVLVIFTFVCFLYVCGSRFAIQSLLQRQHSQGERVIVYGAGDAGAHLAASLSNGQDYTPVAFVDDNRALYGSVIHGVEVFSPEKIPDLIERFGATRVLLAIPSSSRRRRREILEHLENLLVRVQSMPDLADIITGKTQFDDISDVDVADLLGRDAVPPDDSLLDSCIRGKVVMVTGAGGSIGSELCRQMVRQSPTMLLLLENSEHALYTIDKELRGMVQDGLTSCRIIPLLGSAEDNARVQGVMTSFRVQTVYHAAAYKHVPIVEQNIVEGVRNNVFGTLNCAEAAIKANVETFVLVSTDKAVCPTNVMGATKRLSEMVLQAFDEREGNTRFCMVRFGNVLASSGSVVPLFREQIQSGGPVTVTHPEIIRYFMTIPEAAQLVIQAGSMGQGGDVFLLDMGKPVRIEDLARRMIHLMGMTVMDDENPDGDIEITYTGLRPAEKLYEELLIGNQIMGTEHPKIMRAEEKMLPWAEMRELLNKLQDALAKSDSESVLNILRTAVDEYTASATIVDLVWLAQNAQKSDRRVTGTVTTIASAKQV